SSRRAGPTASSTAYCAANNGFRLEYDYVDVDAGDLDRGDEPRIAVEQMRQRIHTAGGSAPSLPRFAVRRVAEHFLANGEKGPAELGVVDGAQAAGLLDGSLQDRGQRIRVAIPPVLQPGIVEDGFADGRRHARGRGGADRGAKIELVRLLVAGSPELFGT